MSKLSIWAGTIITATVLAVLFVWRTWITVRLLVGCSSFSYNAVLTADLGNVLWKFSSGKKNVLWKFTLGRQRKLSLVPQIAQWSLARPRSFCHVVLVRARSLNVYWALGSRQGGTYWRTVWDLAPNARTMLRVGVTTTTLELVANNPQVDAVLKCQGFRNSSSSCLQLVANEHTMYELVRSNYLCQRTEAEITDSS